MSNIFDGFELGDYEEDALEAMEIAKEEKARSLGLPITTETPAMPASVAPAVPTQAQAKPAASPHKFCGYPLPAEIDLSHVDIENPNGLVGEIVGLMRDGANREVKGGAYTLMALQILSATAGRVRGYRRAKLSLLTITLGISAGGKDRPQQVAKYFMKELGIAVSGDIRSDKDVLRSVVSDNARCVFIADEAQKILYKSKGEKDQRKDVQTVIMELATTSHFNFAPLHKAEFSEKYIKLLEGLEKKLNAKEQDLSLVNMDVRSDAEKQPKIVEAIKKLQKEIEILKRHIHVINTGIIDPSVSLSAFSTPAKLADIIDEEMIESGFLGRALIADCGGEAEPLNEELEDDEDGIIHAQLQLRQEAILDKLKAIYEISLEDSPARISAEMAGGLFQAEDGVRELIKTIRIFYDGQNEFRNHPRVGALFRRMLERIKALVSILALDSIPFQGVAIVKKEHVLFALAIILQSISMLESNLKVNEGATSGLMEDKLKALDESILKALKSGEFKYKSKIKDSIKRREFYQVIDKVAATARQDAFENAINKLCAIGMIVHSECGKMVKLR
ncbi:MAG: hypothetical protein ACRCWB_11710 [Enterovibrio sp.]